MLLRALLWTFFLASPAYAQKSMATAKSTATESSDKKDAVAKQRKVIDENLATAKITMEIVETDDLIVAILGPKEKAKTIAASAQKIHAAAAKTLQFSTTEPVWTGKLTVQVFTDSRKYKEYVLRVLKQPTRNRESHRTLLRGDAPTLLVNSSSIEAAAHDAQEMTASALLQRKAGITANDSLPEWLMLGFAESISLRQDAARLGTFRSKAKLAYSKSSGEIFSIDKLGSGDEFPQREIVAASFVDYMIHGLEADTFPKFLAAAKADENGNFPSIQAATKAAGWEVKDLEKVWKPAVASGK